MPSLNKIQLHINKYQYFWHSMDKNIWYVVFVCSVAHWITLPLDSFLSVQFSIKQSKPGVSSTSPGWYEWMPGNLRDSGQVRQGSTGWPKLTSGMYLLNVLESQTGCTTTAVLLEKNPEQKQLIAGGIHKICSMHKFFICIISVSSIHTNRLIDKIKFWIG